MDFGDLGGTQKFTRRPKRENERIHICGGSARSNFSGHSGGFKGSMAHILFTNAQNIGGVENRGRSAKFVDYISREKECLSLYGDKEQAKKTFKNIEDELLTKRKNSVIQRRLVVQLPREFLNNPDKNLGKLCKILDEKYFSVSKAFVAALHAGGSDFKNPHLHIVFANCDENYKNIREYNSKDFVNSIKKDIALFICQEIGIKCEVSDKKKGSTHYPRWVSEAYKRALNDKSGELMQKYSEKYKQFAAFAAEQNLKLYEKVIINKENKLKKTAEQEINSVKNLNENIKKKASGFVGKFYSKKEKEQLNQDIAINNEIISEIKNSVGGYDFSDELLRKEKEKQEKLKKNKDEKKELVKIVKEMDDTVILSPGYFNPHNWSKADIEAVPKKREMLNSIAHDRTTDFKAAFVNAKYDFKNAGGLVITKAENPDWKEKLDSFITEDKNSFPQKTKELEELNSLNCSQDISQEVDGFTKSFTENLNLNKGKGKGFGR
ncbi:MAG: hypothetical protein ACYCT7_04230 [bacterium]